DIAVGSTFNSAVLASFGAVPVGAGLPVNAGLSAVIVVPRPGLPPVAATIGLAISAIGTALAAAITLLLCRGFQIDKAGDIDRARQIGGRRTGDTVEVGRDFNR
ncbi:MAG: hypothetical protein ABJH21_09385, partial [Parasphingorhabdus sp.]|uniref:hypothetical protein n=1 Tax=Parasphingorhabdus sp. TaxID=2709688 RepID=UPI0032975DB2